MSQQYGLVKINEVDELVEGQFLNEKRRLMMECLVALN